MTGNDGVESSDDKPVAVRNLGWLARSSGLILSARFVGVLVGIVTQVFIARTLGASDLGLFFIATAISMILATLLASGYPMLVPKLVAKEFATTANAPQRTASLRQYMAHARASIVRAGIVLCSLSVLAIWFWPSLGEFERIIWSIAVLTALPLAFLRLNGALANALRKFSLGYLPDILVRPLLLLVLIAVLWLFFPHFGLLAVLLGHVFIAGMLATWQITQLSIPLENETQSKPVVEPPLNQNEHKHIKREWFWQSLNLLPAAVFVMVFGDVALLVTGLFLTTQDVGIFGVVMRMSLLAGFAIQTVHQVMVRDLADALHEKATGKLKQSLKRANLFSTLLGVAGLGFVILFGQQLLGIFGPEFTAGYYSLIILMAAQLIRAISGPVMQMIALTDLQRASLPAFAAGLLVLIGSSALLMPTFSLVGAALSVFLATATWSIWLAVLIWTKRDINVTLTNV